MGGQVTRRAALGAACAGGMTWLAAAQGASEPRARPHVRCHPLIEAHRGDSAGAPECTLPAIERAITLGADRVEIDLRTTRDGKLVVIHDDTVDRTTNGRGAVKDLDFAAIRKLDAGSWFGGAFAGARVPTFREVLDVAKGKIMVDIDLKVADAVPAMVAEIRDAGMIDQVVITGEIPACADAIRALAPTMTMFSEAGGIEQGIAIARKHQLRGLNFAHEILTAEFIRQAHLHGVCVTAWTVDDPSRIRELAEWGVDAIMTNETEKAIRTIEAAGLFRGR